MDLEVQFISHATLKIRGEHGTLLTDPWFLNEPVYNLSTWKFPAAVVPPEEVVADVDYVFITHSHEDHFHVPSIDRLSRDVTILLPAYDEHPSLRAHTTERVLRDLGFCDIRRIRSWGSFQLGAQTKLTVVPAAPSRDHDWENSGLVIEHPGCTLLNMNDNVNDEVLCRQIHERWPNIDIAFVQSGGVTMFPGCFRMSEDEMRRAALERKVAFRDQRRTLEHIRPKRIAPFAGDFCWLDDGNFHNNWANRTTNELFEQMVQRDFGHTGVELVSMCPDDRWSMKTGHVRNHPEIDWSDMVGEIRAVKRRFQPKVDAIASWLRDADRTNLEARSRQRCELVQRAITRDFIDFTGRFRLAIEGPNAGFDFVLAANPEDGFRIDFDDKGDVDQTLYIAEHVWASILDGRLAWNIVQWVGEAEQHVPFRREMGRFWFWLEYHVDLGTKNIQAVLDERILAPGTPRTRPRHGTFEMPNEWR